MSISRAVSETYKSLPGCRAVTRSRHPRAQNRSVPLKASSISQQRISRLERNAINVKGRIEGIESWRAATCLYRGCNLRDITERKAPFNRRPRHRTKRSLVWPGQKERVEQGRWGGPRWLKRADPIIRVEEIISEPSSSRATRAMSLSPRPMSLRSTLPSFFVSFLVQGRYSSLDTGIPNSSQVSQTRDAMKFRDGREERRWRSEGISQPPSRYDLSLSRQRRIAYYRNYISIQWRQWR